MEINKAGLHLDRQPDAPTRKIASHGSKYRIKGSQIRSVLVADLKCICRIRGVVEDVSDLASAGGDTASACKRKSLAA